MRHTRVLEIDGLESRRLLTKLHAIPAHLVHAEVVAPLALDGTPVVNQKAGASSQDSLGEVVRETPVAGVLAGTGKVQGTWTEIADAYGDPLGDDTLVLHNPQGSFVVTFSTLHHGKVQTTATGTSFKPIAQHVHGGTKGYAHVAEAGTITVNTNPAGKDVVSLTLATGSV